jgi:hypothetical protein
MESVDQDDEIEFINVEAPTGQEEDPQVKFIKAVRTSFKEKSWAWVQFKADWTQITRKDLPKTVGDFCVKPVALWAPHLLIQGYQPHCPKCKSKDRVDINGFRFVSNPRILHGMCS